MTHHNLVVIHIDKKKYESADPTTGEALYELGNIDAKEYDLFREIPGPEDDVLIKADTSPVDLKNGVHFYSVQKSLNPGSTNG